MTKKITKRRASPKVTHWEDTEEGAATLRAIRSALGAGIACSPHGMGGIQPSSNDHPAYREAFELARAHRLAPVHFDREIQKIADRGFRDGSH